MRRRCHSETRASRVQSNSKERLTCAEGQHWRFQRRILPYGTTIGSNEESGGGLGACSAYQNNSCVPVCSANMATVSRRPERLQNPTRLQDRGISNTDRICCDNWVINILPYLPIQTLSLQHTSTIAQRKKKRKKKKISFIVCSVNLVRRTYHWYKNNSYFRFNLICLP